MYVVQCQCGVQAQGASKRQAQSVFYQHLQAPWRTPEEDHAVIPEESGLARRGKDGVGILKGGE